MQKLLKYWTIRWWDDRSIDSLTHHILLKILGFVNFHDEEMFIFLDFEIHCCGEYSCHPPYISLPYSKVSQASKLRYCQKATICEKISTRFNVCSVMSKQVGFFFQIFVPFSENLKSSVPNTSHYHLEVQANSKKNCPKKPMLFLVSMGKTGLSHDIFFKFSVGPFEVIEVE